MRRQKSIFDKIGSLVPGYRGYAERDGRRQTDSLLRQRVADNLDKCATTVEDRIEQILRTDERPLLPLYERCRKRLDTLAASIRYAPHGASSFFSDEQVREEELQHLYDVDHALATSANALTDELARLDPDSVLAKIDGLMEILDRRKGFLREHK